MKNTNDTQNLQKSCLYDFPIDMHDLRNVHTQLILLTGHNKRVLEIGCSTGFMSRYLVKHGCHVTGVEIDLVAAARSKEICSRVIVGNIESEAITSQISGPFDVVLLGDVLEHLVDPGLVLEQTKKWLSKDGYLLLSVPNVAHWTMRLSLLFGKFEYKTVGLLDRSHLRFFTWRSLSSMLRESGYSIRQKVVLSHCPIQDIPLGLLLSLRRSAYWRNLIERAEYRLAQWFPTLFGVHFVLRASSRPTEVSQ